MNDSHFSERIGWLNAVLAAQRNTLSTILCRLKAIGVRAGTSLSLHRKFMRLMEQIATDQEKELGIIHEIEVIEKRHADMKRRRMLRCAGEECSPPVHQKLQNLKVDEPKRSGLLTLLGLAYLFGKPVVKHKNQGLTGD